MGNWQEEQTLLARLGPFNPRDRSQQVLTRQRVIDHDEQMPPKEYASTQQMSFIDPSSNSKYQNGPKVGPRARLLETRMMEQVEREFSESTLREEEIRNKLTYETEAKILQEATGFRPMTNKEHLMTLGRDPHGTTHHTEAAITQYTDQHGTTDFTRKKIEVPSWDTRDVVPQRNYFTW